MTSSVVARPPCFRALPRVFALARLGPRSGAPGGISPVRRRSVLRWPWVHLRVGPPRRDRVPGRNDVVAQSWPLPTDDPEISGSSCTNPWRIADFVRGEAPRSGRNRRGRKGRPLPGVRRAAASRILRKNDETTEG